MSTPQAFDSLAPTYDNTFTDTQIGRYLRARVHTRLDLHFHAGDHVLELGCGTGEDALYLAGRGVHVTATDASEAMLEIARAKTAGNPLARVESLDLRTLAQVPLPEGEGLRVRAFDGAFSNFGALNCLDDWRPLAAWLAERVKPGGIVGLGIMSPWCVWEVLWHGLHLDFRTATRRWRKGATFQPETRGLNLLPDPITVYYPTIRRITRDFTPHFRRAHGEAVGLFLPPSDAFGVIEKRRRLLEFLMNLDRRLAGYGKLALFADHYWIELERATER